MIKLFLAFLLLPLFLFSDTPTRTEDRGPATIDVSTYAARYRSDYKVFASKCSQCHTLARPINTSGTEGSWTATVSRMARMPGAGMSAAQSEQILEFLIFDQAERKDKTFCFLAGRKNV